MVYGVGLGFRGFTLLGSAAIGLAAYIATGSGGFLYPSLFIGVVPVASALALRLVSPWLSHSVEAPVEAAEDSTVEVRVTVSLWGARLRVEPLGRGSCARTLGGYALSCRVRVGLGVNEVVLPRLAVYDPLQASYVVYDPGVIRVYGLPQPRRVGVAELLAGKLAEAGGEAPSPLGDVFHSVREAEAVEPPTRIDWRATARRGVLVAKVFSEAGGPPLTIVVAASPASIRGARGYTLFEEEARSVVGLVDELCSVGVRVRIIVFTSRGRSVEATGCGDEAARALARFEWKPADPAAVESLLASLPKPVILVTGPDYAGLRLPEGVRLVTSPKELGKAIVRALGGAIEG